MSPTLDFSALTDEQRRVRRLIMDAAGCFRCPSLQITRGRNAVGYDCLKVECPRMRLIVDALAKAAKARGPVNSKELPLTPDGRSI